jgi:hypothetical protein
MSQHWISVTESAFPWEIAALRYLRERLPEQEPFRAWANFEFVADDGSINEVDLLAVSLYKSTGACPRPSAEPSTGPVSDHPSAPIG